VCAADFWKSPAFDNDCFNADVLSGLQKQNPGDRQLAVRAEDGSKQAGWSVSFL